MTISSGTMLILDMVHGVVSREPSDACVEVMTQLAGVGNANLPDQNLLRWTLSSAVT